MHTVHICKSTSYCTHDARRETNTAPPTTHTASLDTHTASTATHAAPPATHMRTAHQSIHHQLHI